MRASSQGESCMVVRYWSALVIMVVAAVAHAETQRETWNKPTTPFKIIGNVYYVGTNGLAAYLITTPKGDFLIDGGLAESAPLIEANIKALGFNLTDIKYLLNSHAHLDHSGGLEQLKKDTGAPLIASEGDKSALEGGFYLGSENIHAMDSIPVKVDRTITDGEKLSLGGVSLTANLTPGHTRGCTSWSWPVTENGKTWQVMVFCSATVAANRLVGPPQYEGIVADYEKTFAKAKNFKVDVFLAPHPEFFHMNEKRARIKEGEPNPFVDPTEFPAFVEKTEAAFKVELAKQQEKAR
jgi:metallo-beta-lactamase class B